MSSDTQRQYSSSEGHSDADQSSFRSSLEDISDTDIPERAPNPSPYPQGKFTIIEELYYEEVYCEDGYEADEDLPPRAKQRSKWAVRCRAADRLPVKYERDEDSPWHPPFPEEITIHPRAADDLVQDEIVRGYCRSDNIDTSYLSDDPVTEEIYDVYGGSDTDYTCEEVTAIGRRI